MRVRYVQAETVCVWTIFRLCNASELIQVSRPSLVLDSSVDGSRASGLEHHHTNTSSSLIIASRGTCHRCRSPVVQVEVEQAVTHTKLESV